jgi:hypothetical protein
MKRFLTLGFGGKFIQALPVDPEAGKIRNFNYSYVSVKDGSGKIAAGSPCITGDGTAETNWWGQLPECPF